MRRLEHGGNSIVIRQSGFGWNYRLFDFTAFPQKNEMFAVDMRNVAYSLESIYLNTKYPNIFQSPDSFVRDYSAERPSDPDIPHLKAVRCETNLVKPNETLFLLIRLVDAGRNLSTRNGVEVRNKLNNYNIPVINEGFGWVSCSVDIPGDAQRGAHRISFRLEDRNEKENEQEFEYVVI